MPAVSRCAVASGEEAATVRYIALLGCLSKATAMATSVDTARPGWRPLSMRGNWLPRVITGLIAASQDVQAGGRAHPRRGRGQPARRLLAGVALAGLATLGLGPVPASAAPPTQ